MTIIVSSCIDDGHYEILPIGKSEFRSLSFLSGRQEGSEACVRLLILPDEASYIRPQILTELEQVGKLAESNVLLPFDVVEISNTSLALVYPPIGQVSMAKVLDRSEHALTETVALAVTDAVLQAMVFLQEAHCTLGGLDPHGVCLLGHKQVQLGPVLLPCCQAFAENTPSLLLPPEADPQQLTSQQECYSVAVLLLCCFNKGLWNSGIHSSGTQQFVRDQGMGDYIDGLLDISDHTRELLHTALADDEQERYVDAASFKEDVNRAMAGLSLRVARGDTSDAGGQVEGMRSNLFNTVDISEHLEKKKDASEEQMGMMNHKALKALSRLVVVNRSQTKARIILAPGTSFARHILEALLKEAGIVYGMSEAAFNEATMALPEVRRIVLATGDVPRPGKVGKSVYGTVIEARALGIDLEISADAMTAYIHSVPRSALRRRDVDYLLNSKDIVCGVDVRSIESLCQYGSDESGKTIIARGRKSVPDQSACFRLQQSLTVHVAHEEDVRTAKVKRGDIVAVWYEWVSGVTGETIHGDILTTSSKVGKSFTDLAGEGVEIHRENKQVFLKATRDGTAQKLASGLLEVLEMEEFYSDIDQAGTVVDSDKLLHVYGNVRNQVSLQSRAGIIIEGDVNDVSIVSCGDLSVSGDMTTGDKEIHVSGIVRACNLRGCTIIAGGFEIGEDIIDCELISLGHVWARSIINSTVTAASDIECSHAGDEDASLVKLWSGHHVPLAIEKEMVQLQERRLTSERSRMVANRNELAEDLECMKQREFRYNIGGFIKGEHMQLMHDRLAHVKARNDSLAASLEEVRHIIVGHKERSDDIQETVDDARACIHIGEALPGVEIKVSESATRVITQATQDLVHKLR